MDVGCLCSGVVRVENSACTSLRQKGACVCLLFPAGAQQQLNEVG